MSRVCGPHLRRGAAAVLACLILAGCSSSAPTPLVIYVTPAPTPSPIIVFVTPEPTPTPTVAPTLAPTATVTASPSPTAAVTSRAAMCLGNDTNRAFFEEAAANLSFDVYCAVLPSNWWLQQGSYTLPNGGRLVVEYRNSAGAVFHVSEGNVCPAPCATGGTNLGPAMFGDRSGTLLGVSGNFLLIVGPLYTPIYQVIGTGVSQSSFTAWAAAVRKVPKP